MRRRVHPRTRAAGGARRRQVVVDHAGYVGRVRSEQSERSPPQSLLSTRCNMKNGHENIQFRAQKVKFSHFGHENAGFRAQNLYLLDNYLVAGLENFSRSQFPYVFPLGELPVVTIHITPSIPRLNTYEWHIRMLLRW